MNVLYNHLNSTHMYHMSSHVFATAAVDPARVKELSQLSLLSNYNLSTAEPYRVVLRSTPREAYLHYCLFCRVVTCVRQAAECQYHSRYHLSTVAHAGNDMRGLEEIIAQVIGCNENLS